VAGTGGGSIFKALLGEEAFLDTGTGGEAVAAAERGLGGGAGAAALEGGNGAAATWEGSGGGGTGLMDLLVD